MFLFLCDKGRLECVQDAEAHAVGYYGGEYYRQHPSTDGRHGAELRETTAENTQNIYAWFNNIMFLDTVNSVWPAVVVIAALAFVAWWSAKARDKAARKKVVADITAQNIPRAV